MTVSVNALLNLYQFPTGRRLFCLRRLRHALDGGGGHDTLRRRVERAIAADEATRKLEYRWLGSYARTEHGPEGPLLHAELGRALGALDGFLASTAKVFGEGSRRGRSASRARSLLFPKGVRHVTSLPYVEEEEAVRAMLGLVQDERELARLLRELGVQEVVEGVAKLNLRYAEVLHVKQDSSEVSYDHVQAARRAGQTALREIVFLVVAQLVLGEGQGKPLEGLSQALEEVLAQNEAIKRYYRRRRRVADVDPETGGELGEESGADPTLNVLPADPEAEAA